MTVCTVKETELKLNTVYFTFMLMLYYFYFSYSLFQCVDNYKMKGANGLQYLVQNTKSSVKPKDNLVHWLHGAYDSYLEKIPFSSNFSRKGWLSLTVKGNVAFW